MCIRDRCVPLVYHPRQSQCTIIQKCILLGWIGDDKPDEDLHRYGSGHTAYGPETYWYTKQYDNGNNTNYHDNNNTGTSYQNPNRPSNGYQCNHNPYPNHVNSQRSPSYGNSPYPNNTCLLYTSRCV